MVNGQYILYGDKPTSESEIVNDHVQTRTAERKNKRKILRNANELQRTLNMAQLDNDTDSVKNEKKSNGPPRLLRYVPTTDVKENFVTENFETYDLKPTEEERPRRYAFRKKAKNSSDGSVNYAYSRSSSSCSSPNGNLPTISEHGEQYGTYRAQPLPSPRDEGEIINRYEHKLDKYFYKQNEIKNYASKVNYEGSHPDSLYRVQAGSGVDVDKMMHVLRLLRWPAALVAICIALGVFIYFLMPDNLDSGVAANFTSWQQINADMRAQGINKSRRPMKQIKTTINKDGTKFGAKTPEIDFYDTESDVNADYSSITDPPIEQSEHVKVKPIEPVFPSHITPEVQYGNEKADVNKLRNPKLLEGTTLFADSTLKPHITQKPEKPLAVYFEDLTEDTTTNAETFTRAETGNEFTNYGDKQTTKNVEISTKARPVAQKDYDTLIPKTKPLNIKYFLLNVPRSPEIHVYNDASAPVRIDANFTSGHSKLFGISMEDAERMRSTTQSSLYNTRVSPTLPTWRDGDDATTKNYPANANYEVVQCRSTRIPLCQGIHHYDLAGLPVRIDDVDIAAMLPMIEYLASTNCSDRVRQFACTLLEPECTSPPAVSMQPCYSFCRAIVESCDKLIPTQLSPLFDCQKYTHSSKCVPILRPCSVNEQACSDRTCIPKKWICDGNKDCPSGEDEVGCTICEKDEFICKTGSCIPKTWVCDGYSDCPDGEDEYENCKFHKRSEPGEQSAASAPEPVIRHPYLESVEAAPEKRKSASRRTKSGESDSRELLVTSDSNNPYKRNFTRRPSPSRLSLYPRFNQSTANFKPEPTFRKVETKKQETVKTTEKPNENRYGDSVDDFTVGDLGLFDELKKTVVVKNNEQKQPVRTKPNIASRTAQGAIPIHARKDPANYGSSVAKLEKVISGADMMKKSLIDEEPSLDSPETNSTLAEKNLEPSPVPDSRETAVSAHASPCPSGELRCVDGRCITLAQLCDGTVDCSDHADEDNCFT